jgi:transcriptional regulator with XRE-family HTH domain
MDEPWKAQLEAFGNFVRTQRQLANLSLREMAELARISNPYLSQIERGLHEPSIRVIRSIAQALDLSAETLLTQVGLIDDNERSDGKVPGATEAAITADPYLTDGQRSALLAVYRSYVAEARTARSQDADSNGDAPAPPVANEA